MKKHKTIVMIVIVISTIFLAIYCSILLLNYFLQKSLPPIETGPPYEQPIFVITKPEDKKKLKYYKIDRMNNYIETDHFVSDSFTTYDVYGCLKAYIDHDKNKVLNKLDDEYCEIKQENKNIEIAGDFYDIVNAMVSIEGDTHFYQKILKYKNEYYVVVSLNVNLWTPYKLFKYDKESKQLVKICTFDGEDIVGLKIDE